MESLLKSSERHFTPAEIAELWNLDVGSVRNLFRMEEGVLKIGNDRSTARKRSHTTLRIPESVVVRVHRRLQVKG